MKYLRTALTNIWIYLNRMTIEETLIRIVSNYDTVTRLSIVKGHFDPSVIKILTEKGLIFTFKETHDQYYDKHQVSYVVSGVVPVDAVDEFSIVRGSSSLLVFMDTKNCNDVHEAINRTRGILLIDPKKVRFNIKLIKPVDVLALLSRLEELAD